MRYCKHIVRGRCLLVCIFFCTALTVLLYFWHSKTQTAFHSMYVMKLITVTLLLCNSGRRKPTSPTTEKGWLSRAMISIILALMDLAFWVVSLKCSYSFKLLLDLLTVRSTQQTLWSKIGMLCSATFYVASLRHVPPLYRYACQLWHPVFHIGVKLNIVPTPMLAFLANIGRFQYVHLKACASLFVALDLYWICPFLW
jgi:hypothetical protein